MFKFTSAGLSRITNRTQSAMTGCDKHLMERQCAFSATHQSQEDTLLFKCMEKESCPCVKSLLIQGLVCIDPHFFGKQECLKSLFTGLRLDLENLGNRPFLGKVRENRSFCDFYPSQGKARENRLYIPHIIFMNSLHGCLHCGCCISHD